ncbi:hypothetical protein [Amycolatopsis sp. SID8362]|uniref:pPIWI_RE_Y domain-containing protein n=1 Tax=Amycolatopsis sp. SID8362 TaxID=2690346 RepID=UPI00136AE58A|nr:hypothetical protein [Amycolatopsis sp. SID8362]NBH06792.1 hypothetical protein [Amycolatopsis sp. SID8362]NED43489.1 hypothetical protein [Amycolatopsis sp. SID8362]
MIDWTSLLDQLARGVAALSDHNSSGAPVPPYPRETQYALDLIVHECLRHGLTPPAGVPELIQWCTNLSGQQWPFPPAFRLDGLALVTSVQRTRTRACAELAGLANVADELLSDAVADAPDSAARRQLLRSQVLVGPDTHRELLMRNPKAASAFRFVKDLYRPPSDEWVTHGKVALCGCGLPARLDSHDDRLTVWCERETCPPGAVSQLLPAAKALLLHPALRLFLALPAQLEDRLRNGLNAAGQAGHRDEVRFSDGRARPFRCYDRVVPVALARDAVAGGVEIAVVPDDSAMADPDARWAFADALPTGTTIALMTEGELIAQAHPAERTPDA